MASSYTSSVSSARNQSDSSKDNPATAFLASPCNGAQQLVIEDIYVWLLRSGIKKTIELHLSSTWSDNSRFFCSSKQICKGMHIVVTWWVPSAVHVVAAVTHRMKSWPCRATRADMHDALGDGYVPHTTPLPPPPLNVELTMAVRFGAQRWVGRLARKTMMTARTSTLAHPDLHPTLIHVARSSLPMSRIALIHTVGNLLLQICHQVRCLEQGGQPRVSLRLEHACSTHDLGIRGRRGGCMIHPTHAINVGYRMLTNLLTVFTGDMGVSEYFLPLVSYDEDKLLFLWGIIVPNVQGALSGTQVLLPMIEMVFLQIGTSVSYYKTFFYFFYKSNYLKFNHIYKRPWYSLRFIL